MGAYLNPFQSLGQQVIGSALDAWQLLRFSVGSITALALLVAIGVPDTVPGSPRSACRGSGRSPVQL